VNNVLTLPGAGGEHPADGVQAAILRPRSSSSRRAECAVARRPRGVWDGYVAMIVGDGGRGLIGV